MASKLYTPIRLRELELPNRVAVGPMCQYAAEYDGNATDYHLMHLGNFAVSGSGLVISEATGVEPEGRISPWCLGLYSDENEAAMARIVAFFTRYGGNTKFGIQLAHAGRKASVPPSFMVREPVLPENGGWVPISPSPYHDGVHPDPEVMDLARIARVRRAWREAVQRAARIGVDLIEMHFAHGYLVNQFLSPVINKRDDSYGGSLDNRMRLALELFSECRAVWPQDRPMGVRISAVDWIEGGWTIDDSIVLARQLKELGCDYICCTSGGVSREQKIAAGPNYQVPYADAVRRGADIATMATGQITGARQAEDILQAGQADMVALARRMMFNPRWPWHAALELNDFVMYPERYRTAHPLMGEVAKFVDMPEYTEALQTLWRANKSVAD